VEVILSAGSSNTAIATAFEVGTEAGQDLVRCEGCPWILCQSLFGSILGQSLALIRDGVPLEKLSQSMKKFGMPVGPITLADEVGTFVSEYP
jgi:enoyl-CoA hydratase/long-chain 3-hydroxyacyl-CoA dehydrogenase